MPAFFRKTISACSTLEDELEVVLVSTYEYWSISVHCTAHFDDTFTSVALVTPPAAKHGGRDRRAARDATMLTAPECLQDTADRSKEAALLAAHNFIEKRKFMAKLMPRV